MAINVNSAATSYNFIFRNYYSKNRDAAKEITRGNVKKDDLITADSDALAQISKTLRNLEYSSENGVGIYNNVRAFTDTYNNLVSSTSDSAAYDVTQPNKLLKNLIKSKKDELEDIGISVSASGKLTLKKETLLQSSPSKIAKIFSSDSEFTQKVRYYAGKIYRASNSISLSAPGASFVASSVSDSSAGSTAGEQKSIFDATV